MRVEDSRARHCATANCRNSLVLDARAWPRLVVTNHGRFRSENLHGVLPVNLFVRRALVAKHINTILIGTFLCEIGEPTARIREKATE
jgi:hypothetical protein